MIRRTKEGAIVGFFGLETRAVKKKNVSGELIKIRNNEVQTDENGACERQVAGQTSASSVRLGCHCDLD